MGLSVLGLTLNPKLRRNYGLGLKDLDFWDNALKSLEIGLEVQGEYDIRVTYIITLLFINAREPPSTVGGVGWRFRAEGSGSRSLFCRNTIVRRVQGCGSRMKVGGPCT